MPEGTAQNPSQGSKPFAVWVVAGGTIFAAVLLLGIFLAIPFVSTAGPAYYSALPFFVLFFVVLVVPASFAWREKRWAYLATAIVALVIAVLSFAPNALSNPADTDFAWDVLMVPILLLVAGFGILAFRAAKTGLRQKPYLASVHSSGGLLTLAVAGFVVGMLIAGAIGAGVILRMIPEIPADIEIVPDAINVPIAYSPNVFTVSVGATVTWINRDMTAHTVTSNVTGQFDSGTMTTGQTWGFTFTQAGTYYYFCTFHPQMTGTIVVQ
ncbi:MAG TPA: cupredoxin family copper-binding protein [Thermoplasmata archaeon]